MKQITKRWLSLLLAAALCVTAGGIPALAAEDEDTGSSTETADTGDSGNASESGADNGITTLPTTGEERPVISVDVPDTGEDSGDTTVTEPENPEKPENPDTPSDEQHPAEETKPQDGNSSTSAVTEQPAAIPKYFFQSVEVGKAYKDGKITEFDSDVEWNSSCAVLFRYKVSEDMTVGTKYTFKVDAPLEMDVAFTIRNDKDEPIADGVIGKDGESYLVFRDGAQDYAKAGVDGYFYVGTKFKESEVSSGGKQTIDIKIDGTTVWSDQIDFAAPKAEASVAIAKWPNAITYEKDHQIEWTIRVTPTTKNIDHIDSLVVTDPLKDNNLEYVPDSAVARINREDGPKAVGQVVYDDESGKLIFTGEGDDLKQDSWPIYITFRTQYDLNKLPALNQYGQAIFHNNNATAEIKAPQFDKVDGSVTLVPKQITSSASTSKDAEILILYLDKQGSLTSGNTIHWTITATTA